MNGPKKEHMVNESKMNTSVFQALRGMNVQGQTLVEHAMVYKAARYLTRHRPSRMQHGIPDRLSWGEVKEDVDAWQELLTHVHRLFAITHLDTTLALQYPDAHHEILNEFSTHFPNVDMDSFFTSSRTSQYTDRGLCDLIVSSVAPRPTESICDPFMGGGSILTSYVRYMDGRFHQMSEVIHGMDLNPSIVSVAKLRVFLHMIGNGYVSSSMRAGDALRDDLPQPGYDVFITRMPFGIRGLKHAECCERVKALKIRGTKSEPLFLQLLMVSLHAGGRCAVVVPNSLLINDSECHIGTRQHLLDHFEVREVVRLVDTDTSLLVFANGGAPTTSVTFSEWSNPVKSTVVVVPRLDLQHASLDVRKYLPFERSSRYPVVPLHTVASITLGSTPCRSEAHHFGTDPDRAWVTTKELQHNVLTTTKESLTDTGVAATTAKCVPAGTILFSYKQSIGKCAIAGKPMYCSDAVAALHTLDEHVLMNNYLFHFLRLYDYQRFDKPLNRGSIGELDIVLPPVEEQARMVSQWNMVWESRILWQQAVDHVNAVQSQLETRIALTVDATDAPITDLLQFVRKAMSELERLQADAKVEVKATLSIAEQIKRKGARVIIEE